MSSDVQDEENCQIAESFSSLEIILDTGMEAV